MSIYYDSNPSSVVSSIVADGTTTYTISFDASAFPDFLADGGHFAAWFVFSNDSSGNTGVTVGPSRTDTVWGSDPLNYAVFNGNVISTTFTFPSFATSFVAYGPVNKSYDPTAQTYVSVFGLTNSFNLVYLLVGQSVSVTVPPPPPPIVCFKEDSKILTKQGYKNVQDLRKGDLVKTLKHDYVPIDMIGKKEIYHPASDERIKDQLYKCSKDVFEEVFEDLVITGCHCILTDNFSSEKQKEDVLKVNKKIYVTDRKYRIPACVDERTSVYENAGKHTIYHFALENDDYYMNYGVYANGLLVETCSKRYLKELSNMELF
jgi:hypothetical protein